jgi:membrane protease YdiL (CAAX protease family)
VGTLSVWLATWTLLLAAPLLAPCAGADGALLATQGAAALVLASTRVRAGLPTPPARIALALAAGIAAYPVCASLTAALGLALGLAPLPDAARPAGPLLCASLLVTAPACEELLYRERLFGALRARMRAAPAVVATSALFALPHLEPWPMLGAFVAGLLLGALRARGASIGACIALHAGLNLASLC